MGDIYISTLAFAGKKAEDIIQIAENHGLNLEFSSGMPYRENMEAIYLSAAIKKMPHNYFPSPNTPFVLNLASANATIRSRSIEHCLKGIYLSKQSGGSLFSAHAGFCIDPNPEELGQKISYDPAFKKENHLTLFLDSLQTILDNAEDLRMQFLFENNVIASYNIVNKGVNPVLCCESTEIIYVLRELNNKRLGLLLDTAHLKVSCQTLGIDKNDEVRKLYPYIQVIHHSDNDGLKDTNDALNQGYWFLQHLANFRDLLHVVEVKNIDVSTIKQQMKLLQGYGC